MICSSTLANGIRYRVYDRAADVPRSLEPELQRLTLPTGLMWGRYISAWMRNSPGKVVIAFNGSHPVGWNLVDYKRVINQYVRKSWRGKGIGSLLLQTTANAAGIKLTRKAVYSHMPDARKVLKRARKVL